MNNVMATEQGIIDDLFRVYGLPAFRSRDFHAYRAAPLNQRMFLSMRILEAEVCNGGLAQFLWNVFFHWRAITEDCAHAYIAIGATAQASAIPEITRILSAHEASCREYVERAIATKDFSQFEAWYELGERAMSSPIDKLFYDATMLAAQRLRWLSSNAVCPED